MSSQARTCARQRADDQQHHDPARHVSPVSSPHPPPRYESLPANASLTEVDLEPLPPGHRQAPSSDGAGGARPPINPAVAADGNPPKPSQADRASGPAQAGHAAGWNGDRGGQGGRGAVGGEGGRGDRRGDRRVDHGDSIGPGTMALPTSSLPVSALHPRVAVMLGVPPAWHPVLFLFRLASIAPAVNWGLPTTVRLLLQLHQLYKLKLLVDGQDPTGSGTEPHLSLEARLRVSETFLAIIWCGSSAYLSYFFTDCLMSRWLVNYTPQATVVRLVTVGLLNYHSTSLVLYLWGCLEDPRLHLPAWVAISTTLTFLYHVTQRNINIRKETKISISVFSIASYISMVMMLWMQYLNRTDIPDIPMALFARWVWHQTKQLARIFLGNATNNL